jgi:hypothetical protein
MLPQTNATLLKVERTAGTSGGGFTEDYDRPATDPEAAGGEGGDVWAGKTAVYWIERRRRISIGNESKHVIERSLILDPQRPEVEFVEGMHVTVEHGGVEKRGKVSVVESRKMPGVAGSLRLTMEDA